MQPQCMHLGTIGRVPGGGGGESGWMSGGGGPGEGVWGRGTSGWGGVGLGVGDQGGCERRSEAFMKIKKDI